MPILPLFAPPEARAAAGASPDAWHRVTAPGGYEWWHFDAEDAAGDVRLVAGLFDGFPFHPGYLRAHARYRRRPTRVAPAVPSQYPCASFTVYEKGQVLATFTGQYPPGAFKASDGRLAIRLGPNVLESGGDGTLHLNMEHVGVTAELSFRPLAPSPPSLAGERRLVARKTCGADHFYVLANPLCEASGAIRISRAGGAAGRVIDVSGRGFHDHWYGSGPIAAGARWVRGRVLGEDRATVFQVAEPLDRSGPTEAHVAEVCADRVRWLPDDGGPARVTWSSDLPHRFRYPASVQIGAGRLSLSRPRVLDAGPFVTRITCDAELVTGAGEVARTRGTALCEVIESRQFRWPFSGRAAGRSIARVGLRPPM